MSQLYLFILYIFQLIILAIATFNALPINLYTCVKWLTYHHHHITVVENYEFDYILISTYQYVVYINMPHVNNYHPFISACRTLFSISCKAVLEVRHSISFCFIWESLYLNFISKGQFFWVRYSWLAVFLLAL